MSNAVATVILSLLGISLAGTLHAQWREGPLLESPRWHHAAAASGDFVFVFGGRMLVGERQRYVHGVAQYGLEYFDTLE